MNPIDRAATRLKHVLRFAKHLVTDDSGPVQRLQVDCGPISPSGASWGIRDKLIRHQEYGFSSSLPPGADVIIICHDGDLTNAAAVASNHQASRPTGLSPGDVCVYDSRGNTIVLAAGGVTITPASGQPVTINGTLVVTGDVTANGISLEHHIHGGVQTGSGNTGAPVT